MGVRDDTRPDGLTWNTVSAMLDARPACDSRHARSAMGWRYYERRLVHPDAKPVGHVWRSPGWKINVPTGWQPVFARVDTVSIFTEGMVVKRDGLQRELVRAGLEYVWWRRPSHGDLPPGAQRSVSRSGWTTWATKPGVRVVRLP